MPAKVAINGYGTIGKRVAAAVSRQDDMRIVGVSKMKPNYEARMAVERGYALYATTKDVLPKFEKAGMKVQGTLDDLLKEADLEMPSHHGPDVQSVLPTVNIHTIALKVPTTIMHVHAVSVELKRTTTAKDVLDVWRRTPRVKFFRGAEGVASTAQIMEVARNLSRNRADLYEIALWEDGVHVVGNTLYYFQAVHQESDVVPENVDAIRAMMEIERDGKASRTKTDRSLGMGG